MQCQRCIDGNLDRSSDSSVRGRGVRGSCDHCAVGRDAKRRASPGTSRDRPRLEYAEEMVVGQGRSTLDERDVPDRPEGCHQAHSSRRAIRQGRQGLRGVEEQDRAACSPRYARLSLRIVQSSPHTLPNNISTTQHPFTCIPGWRQWLRIAASVQPASSRASARMGKRSKARSS